MPGPCYPTRFTAALVLLLLGGSLSAEARPDRPRGSSASTDRLEPGLHRVLTESPLPRISKLLESGANIEARDARGATPLITAAAKGNVPLVRFLLSRQARVAATDKSGNSALHEASLVGCVDCVELLLQAGAPTELHNADGFTPLHQAVRRFWELPGETKRDRLHRQHDIIALLLQQGATPDRRDANGRTPSTLATESNNDVLRGSLAPSSTPLEKGTREPQTSTDQVATPASRLSQAEDIPTSPVTPSAAAAPQKPSLKGHQEGTDTTDPSAGAMRATSPAPPAPAQPAHESTDRQQGSVPGPAAPIAETSASSAIPTAAAPTPAPPAATKANIEPVPQPVNEASRTADQSAQASTDPRSAAAPEPMPSPTSTPDAVHSASRAEHQRSAAAPSAPSSGVGTSVMAEPVLSTASGPAVQEALAPPTEPPAGPVDMPTDVGPRPASVSQVVQQAPEPAPERESPKPSVPISAQTARETTTATTTASVAPPGESTATTQPDRSRDERVREAAGSPWLLRNLGFGLGLGWTHNLGPRRVESVTVVNRIVRIDNEQNDLVRFMPELHVWLDRWDEQRWSWGPFLALAPGSRVVDAVGFGVMLGYRPHHADRYSFNLGVGGVLDLDARVLGDGLVANEPLPPRESSARTKQTTAAGLLVLFSVGWDLAEPQRIPPPRSP